jgi:hypothetical protein
MNPMNPMNPTSCLFGSRFVYNPFYLLAGALLFDEKIRQSVGLDCGMLEFLQLFFSQAVIQKHLLTFPYFWKPVWRKDFVLCTYNSCAE